MDAEADQPCAGGVNSRNGYRERMPKTCVGDITMRIPKLRSGSFFPEDAIERCQRVDRALVAAVAETCATGTSTRKVQRIAEKMGMSKLSKDQVSAIAASLDADVDELGGSPGALRVTRRDLRKAPLGGARRLHGGRLCGQPRRGRLAAKAPRRAHPEPGLQRPRRRHSDRHVPRCGRHT